MLGLQIIGRSSGVFWLIEVVIDTIHFLSDSFHGESLPGNIAAKKLPCALSCTRRCFGCCQVLLVQLI